MREFPGVVGVQADQRQQFSDAAGDVRLAMVGKAREGVKGEIPNPISPPSGCTFHPRCPLVFERCRIENPPAIDGVACHAVNQGSIAAA